MSFLGVRPQTGLAHVEAERRVAKLGVKAAMPQPGNNAKREETPASGVATKRRREPGRQRRRPSSLATTFGGTGSLEPPLRDEVVAECPIAGSAGPRAAGVATSKSTGAWPIRWSS